MDNKAEISEATRTIPERREASWEKVEQKIAILRNIWEEVSKLPRPTNRSSDETIYREGQLFDRLYKSAAERFPEGAKQVSIYKKLKDSIKDQEEENTQKKDEEGWGEREDKLWNMRKSLRSMRQNDDLMFLLVLENGLKVAQWQRAEVRRILRDVGPDYKKPDSYRGKVKDMPEETHGVEIRNFSITFVVPSKYFRNKGEPNQGGLHFHGSIWNVSKTINAEAILLEAIFDGKGKIKDREYAEYDERLKHEDTHAFLEGFFEQDNYDYEIRSHYAFEHIPRIIKFIKHFKEFNFKKDNPLYRHTLLSAKSLIPALADMDHEELLAELASVGHRFIPTRTYAALLKEKNELIDAVKGQDDDIDALIQRLRTSLDLEKLRTGIRQLYQKVEQQSPEHLLDLDFAFALFPPTKIRHIRQLVERWTGKQSLEAKD